MSDRDECRRPILAGDLTVLPAGSWVPPMHVPGSMVVLPALDLACLLAWSARAPGVPASDYALQRWLRWLDAICDEVPEVIEPTSAILAAGEL